MTKTGGGDPHLRTMPPRRGGRWRHAAFPGIVALGVVLLYASRDPVSLPSERSGDPMAQRMQAVVPRPLPTPPSALSTGGAGPATTAGPEADDASGAKRSITLPGQWSVVDVPVVTVDGTRAIAPEGAADLKRWLRDARERGRAAVPAIRDFLRTGQDVKFDKSPGGTEAEPRTLRLALIDVLRQIGGPEATEVALEQLRQTESPGEIAMLALLLEAAAPGVHRGEAIWTVVNALEAMARTRDPVEVRPLFEALRTLGGPETVATLQQFPHNADAVGYLRNKNPHVSPTMGTFALIALAGMPDGEGVSSLAALAGDPNVPMAHKTVGPFQMLAQATVGSADAGEELVALAVAGGIPDRAWDAVANAIAGKHLLLTSPAPIGPNVATANARGTRAGAGFVRGFYDDERNLLYEERLVTQTWSAAQVQRQIALIDSLLATTSAPAATDALQRARESLRRRR